jgi:hypothetical protein
MINIIHYDEDIFFLSIMVKRLIDGLKLELDGPLFLIKIVEEIEFISRSIEYFMSSLQGNNLKVNRLQYLKNLYKLNKLFIELLHGILTDQILFSKNVKNHSAHFSELRDHHISHELKIKSGLHIDKNQMKYDHDMLSEEEYKILLSQAEDD